MKSIWLGSLLAAVLLACMAQPAFAHEFTVSSEATGFIGKGGTQTITLGGNAVTCKSAAIDGHATSELLEMEVAYESCEAFSKPATISGAAYKDTANGSGGVAEGTTMTVTAKPSAESECIYTLPTTSELVAGVSYTNKEKGIVASHTLKGLTYELEAMGTSACGKDGEKSSTGEYKGEVTTESYEGVRCVWWFGGAYYPLCLAFGGFLAELVSGYTTLKWS